MSTQPPLEPTLPHDIKAEQATLGSMLLEPGAVPRAMAVVSPQDFYRMYHRDVATAIWTVVQRHEPVDLTTVAAELRRLGKLEEVGGTEYLTAMIGEVSTAAHVTRYANIVAEKAILRETIHISSEATKRAFEQPEDPAAFLSTLADRYSDLFSARAKNAGPQPVGHYLANLHARILEDLESGKPDVSAARTGIDALDFFTGGLEAQRLIGVLADTKHGKSQLVRQIVLSSAMQMIGSGKIILLFVLEEDKWAYGKKMMAYLGGIDSMALQRPHAWRRYKRDNPDAEDRIGNAYSALGVLADTILIEDKTKHIGKIEAYCRAKAREHEIGLVCVDYYQRITGDEEYGWSDERGKRERGERLQDLADELEVPVVCPAQVTIDAKSGSVKPMGARAFTHNCSLELYWKRANTVEGTLADHGLLICTATRGTPGFAPIEVVTDMSTGRFWDKQQKMKMDELERMAG